MSIFPLPTSLEMIAEERYLKKDSEWERERRLVKRIHYCYWRRTVIADSIAHACMLCISSAIFATFMNQQIKYTCIIINNVHLFSGVGVVCWRYYDHAKYWNQYICTYVHCNIIYIIRISFCFDKTSWYVFY